MDPFNSTNSWEDCTRKSWKVKAANNRGFEWMNNLPRFFCVSNFNPGQQKSSIHETTFFEIQILIFKKTHIENRLLFFTLDKSNCFYVPPKAQ